MPWLGQKREKTSLDHLTILRSKEVIHDFEDRDFKGHEQPEEAPTGQDGTI